MTEHSDPYGWLSPSQKLWKMRCLEVGVPAVVVAIISGVGIAHASPTAGLVTAAGVIVIAAMVLLFLRNRFRSWSYQERSEDLLVSRGVLVNRLSVIPYGRMQFVDVTSGPIERMFGLSTVKLHTAAAATDARIPGLDQAEATRLRERLTALGEAKAAGL